MIHKFLIKRKKFAASSIQRIQMITFSTKISQFLGKIMIYLVKIGKKFQEKNNFFVLSLVPNPEKLKS